MIVEASAAVQGIKAAVQMAKQIKDLQNAAEIGAATVALQDKLRETQEYVFDLQEKVHELQARNAELERLDESKYELTEVEFAGHLFTGRKAYKHVDTEDYYCPVCFGEGKLIPLQSSSSGEYINDCGRCDTSFGHADDYSPEIRTGGRRTNWEGMF